MDLYMRNKLVEREHGYRIYVNNSKRFIYARNTTTIIIIDIIQLNDSR